MTLNESLEQGREHFRRNAWPQAYEQLSAADHDSPLEAPDLELLAIAAQMSGKDEESLSLQERAHHAFLDRGDVEPAARNALWLGMHLMQMGEFAQGGGWVGRAARLIEGRDCVERGWVLLPAGIQSFEQGDYDAAFGIFGQAVGIGERFGDPSLTALARHGQGKVLIRKGEAARGVALLDEAMVQLMSEANVYPIAVGIVYCSVIDACREIFDLRRGQEWTAALTKWSQSQPDLIPFRGQCLVFRAEFMQLHGAWSQALEETVQAARRLSKPPPHPAAGSAFYQEGELHRLRGEFSQAEQAFTRARESGHNPQPGFALLRLAQDRVDAAESAIRREVDEAKDRAARCRILPAFVEIMLASGEVAAAREGADELSKIAEGLDAPFLQGVSSHAIGSVLLDENDPRGSLTHLRHAHERWRDLDAPYEAARTSVLIGLACRQLGDEDTAHLEFKAAGGTFEELGAAPALAKLEELTGSKARAGGLTGREVEVLSLLATGKTNREIANELVISEKTVARHVANIFVKLGVSSRAAATAYAYQHDLL